MNLTPTGIFILILTMIYLVIILLDLLYNFLGFERYVAVGQIVLCIIIIGAVFMLFKRRLR